MPCRYDTIKRDAKWATPFLFELFLFNYDEVDRQAVQAMRTDILFDVADSFDTVTAYTDFIIFNLLRILWVIPSN